MVPSAQVCCILLLLLLPATVALRSSSGCLLNPRPPAPHRTLFYLSSSSNDPPVVPVAACAGYKEGIIQRLLLAATAASSTSALLGPRTAYAAAVEDDCSDSLTVMDDRTGRKVLLFGTAHISQRSADLVREIMQKNRPQVVLVELDAKRVMGDRFTSASDGKGLGSVEILESRGFILPSQSKELLSAAAAKASAGGFFSGAFKGMAAGISGAVLGRLIGQFYKSIESVGLVAGGEFKAAIEEAAKLDNCRVLLGDRDIDATLARLAEAMSQTDEKQFAQLQQRVEQIERESGLASAGEGTFSDKAALTTFVEKVLHNQY